MRQLKISKSITNREVASLDKYLADIAREELISPDEEVTLAQKIRAGDEQALERLVRANLRFVVSVAKQYQNQGISLPDLINEGKLTVEVLGTNAEWFGVTYPQDKENVIRKIASYKVRGEYPFDLWKK